MKIRKKEIKKGDIVKCIKQSDILGFETPVTHTFKVLLSNKEKLDLESVTTFTIYRGVDPNRFEVVNPNIKLYKHLLNES